MEEFLDAVTEGAVPYGQEFASEILARAGLSAAPQSYVVPVTIEASVHKRTRFHTRFAGTQTFGSPDQLTLDVPPIPQQGKHLFCELGTPPSWLRQYDFRIVSRDAEDDAAVAVVIRRTRRVR